MRFPRFKDIRSKLSSARLLGGLLKNSLAFKIKRGAMMRFRATEFDTIIVDMDGTLYDTDANLEALSFLYPEKNEKGVSAGEDLYNSIISKIASGEYSIEQAIVEGNKFLVAKRMARKDFFQVLEKIKPMLRRRLILALKSMKKEGKTIVLATLSSKDFGEILNSHFKEKFGLEFDLVVGTELKYDEDGRISGVAGIVGTKDFDFNGIPVKCKLSAIRSGLENAKKIFDAKKAVLITDSYSDIDVAKTITTILVKPKSSSIAQKVSQRLKLADYILPDNKDLQTNLESIVIGAEKAVQG